LMLEEDVKVGRLALDSRAVEQIARGHGRSVCDDPSAAIESRSGFRYGGVSRLGAQNDFALSAIIQ
jgi:hypothetical protein